jgi:putative thioredoxin
MDQSSETASPFVKTVTTADFDQTVIEGSRQVPVIVDFWAPWCGPCRMLTPVLQKLAEEYQGKFILATVNSDENVDLAQRYGVRSIPTVIGFVDGEPQDQFLGAQPESKVREFIESLVPGQIDLLLREAAEQRVAGNPEVALEFLHQAAALEPSHEAVLAELVETLLDLGRFEEAHEAGSNLGPLRARSHRASQALARLEFAEDPNKVVDAAALETNIKLNPDDLDAHLALAKLYAREHQYEHALEQLLEMVRRDRTFGGDIARKTMVTLFELLGSDHPLVRRYRKELSAVLY